MPPAVAAPAALGRLAKESTMIDWLAKVIVNFIVDMVAAIAGFRFGSFYRAERRRETQEQRQQRRLGMLLDERVKYVNRADGKERIAIVRDGDVFGAVLELKNMDGDDWTSVRQIGGGCVYDSAEAAEKAAAEENTWMKNENKTV
jgi:hypothetical protein